ncbi:ABC transporter permease [Rhodoferax lacus]|uniref:ABC transporter permease n=1 Tax=Rhodoferax lacus TaxID=2184758 RepID=A0A3E1RC47_9BURK|nr:ATP-binding cassette domain-containing protein [Rhodoferax lacus]RFO96622.1 ABC transporter permease [Rhodoferax lacus]
MSTAQTGTQRRRWLVPEVVQTSAMDCGPAALKCLLEGFGVPVSYGRLREACQTDVDGTSIDTIEVVAGQLGLQAEQVMLPLDHVFLPETQALPAMVVVRHKDGSTHFVVVWSRHGQWLQLMDPAVGRRWVTVQRFAEEVFAHQMPVPASGWRAWAASDDFLQPLHSRLRKLGASAAEARLLQQEALQDPLWFGPAALDASVRLVQSVVDAGGLRAGAEALRMVGSLYRQTHGSTGDIFHSIPPAYWSVEPAHTDEAGALQLMLHGAVLLKVAGLQTAASEPLTGQGPSLPLPSAELLTALRQKDARPLQAIWGLLRQDGLLGPWLLAGAMAIAAAVVLLEILLFRGLFDIRWALGLPSQRLAAMAGLMVFIVVLMLVEVPILTEAMRYGRHLDVRLRMALLHKLPTLSDRYFQSRPVSDMADRSHSIHLARMVPGFGLQFIQVACDLAFTLVGIALIDQASLPLAGAIALAALLVPALVQPLLNERDLRVRNHAGALHGFNLDALLGLVPIRTHGAERVLRRQHEGLLVEWTRSARGLITLAQGAQALQSLLCLSLVGSLLYLHFERAGSASGADLLLVYWALKLPAIGQTLCHLAQQYPAQRNMLLRLLEPLNTPAPPVAPPLQTPDPAAPAAAPTPGMGIHIQGGKIVAGGHTVLEDIHLHIAPGEHVAIVGASGAGKSTLLGLLLGWHRLSEGHLHIDGAALTDASQQALRHSTAWVDPAIQIWNRSLLDNLHYACDADSAALDRMATVLDQAQLRRVLQHLPEGMQTALGEGGALLSGGEGQRVRLARALMQSGVRLALLDEPFRGLDRPQREALLTQARQWWRTATLLCVTHDVAETLSFARVLVVEDGRIVEDGVPLRLAQSDSRYRALLEAEKQVRQRLWTGANWRRLQLREGQLVDSATVGSSPTPRAAA